MRQGRNARLPGLKSNARIKSHRSVPSVVVRRGTNSKKGDNVKRDKQRVRRSGIARRSWVVLRSLGIAAFVVAVLGAAGYAGYQAFQHNDFLVLRQVDVVGNHLLGKATILEKAGLELGVKMPSVPIQDVRAALLSIPGVGEVEVKRIFPSRIEIRVKEKEAVAVGFSKGWYGLASDGTKMTGMDWGESDLPIVDGFANLDSTRRAVLGTFLQAAKKSFPSLYANFSQLTLRKEGGVVEVFLRDGRLKVLLGLDAGRSYAQSVGVVQKFDANKSLNSLEFLQALLKQQSAEMETGKTVDLRVEGYAYVH